MHLAGHDMSYWTQRLGGRSKEEIAKNRINKHLSQWHKTVQTKQIDVQNKEPEDVNKEIVKQVLADVYKDSSLDAMKLRLLQVKLIKSEDVHFANGYSPVSIGKIAAEKGLDLKNLNPEDVIRYRNQHKQYPLKILTRTVLPVAATAGLAAGLIATGLAAPVPVVAAALLLAGLYSAVGTLGVIGNAIYNAENSKTNNELTESILRNEVAAALQKDRPRDMQSLQSVDSMGSVDDVKPSSKDRYDLVVTRDQLISGSLETDPVKMAVNLKNVVKYVLNQENKLGDVSVVLQSYENNDLSRSYIQKLGCVLEHPYRSVAESPRNIVSFIGHQFSIKDSDGIKTEGWNSRFALFNMTNCLGMFSNYQLSQMRDGVPGAREKYKETVRLYSRLRSSLSDFSQDYSPDKNQIGQKLNALNPGESLMFPLSVSGKKGFFLSKNIAHAVVHEFTCTAPGTYSWRIFNTGDGISNHEGAETNRKFEAVKEFSGLSKNDVSKTVNDMYELHKMERAGISRRMSQLYKLGKTFQPVAHPEFQHRMQTTGNCSWKSLKAWMHFSMPGLYKEFNAFMDLTAFVDLNKNQDQIFRGQFQDGAVDALKRKVELKFVRHLAKELQKNHSV